MAIQVGDPAPDFTLRDQHGATFTLSSYAGKKAVLLVFYPFAFSGICTGELSAVRDHLGDFETDSTTVLAISCDPVFSQRALADRDGIFFPLLSDFWPHGEVASAYGAFDAEHGCAERSSFVVGKDGRIAWAVHNERGAARDLLDQAGHLRRFG
ncbi:peroxiredoxin [Marmoricola sp. RAF53]|uniref:peroxiredoxin n=1 Tax=Marmoricola sp. RAF53 TaxID=3233059 RepID=UPI003F998DC0